MINEITKYDGQKLKDVREYVGYSEEEVAKYLKASISKVYLIENNQCELDSITLYHLSKLYKHPMVYFTKDDFSIEQNPMSVAFARHFKELSDNDKTELNKFVEYLLIKTRNNE